MLVCSVVATSHAKTENNLPLVYGIFRQDCFEAFSQYDFGNTECLKFSFSKLIGMVIIAGAFILKVPQIIKIVKSNSTAGISTTSYYLETINFANTAALSIHLGLQFSVYGETLVILVQNGIIILLMWSINKSISLVEKLGFLAFFGGFCYIVFEGSLVPEEAWALMSSANILLNISSRIPQVFTNF